MRKALRAVTWLGDKARAYSVDSGHDYTSEVIDVQGKRYDPFRTHQNWYDRDKPNPRPFEPFDFTGEEIHVGDKVAYAVTAGRSAILHFGIVERVTEKSIVVLKRTWQGKMYDDYVASDPKGALRYDKRSALFHLKFPERIMRLGVATDTDRQELTR